MTERLRYGLIGCGMMGREHLANLALIPGSEVVAIADPDPEQRALNATAAPGAVMLDDRAALLARDDIDAILVAAPNHLHADILRAILDGPPRAVLLEKPVCTTGADTDDLLARAAGWPRPIWTAMEYRYMAPVAALIDEIRAGTAGTPRMLSIREHRFPFLAKVGDWNRFNDQTGGTLVEKCCHFFDLMRLILADEPVRVYASGGADVNHRDERYGNRVPDILDNAYTVVDFAGGARAMLELCMFADGSYWQEQIAVTGDAGRVECFVPGPARFWDGTERAAEIEISPRSPKAPVRRALAVDEAILSAGDHHGATYYQHLRFRDAVLTGAPVAVTLADGAAAVRIGLAAEESVRTGQAVPLR